MADKNFKVKNGISLDNQGIIKFDSATSKITISNDGGNTELPLYSASVMNVSTKTSNYTLSLSDANSVVQMDVASANTVTIPLDSTTNFPVGSTIKITQIGAGQTEIVGESGVSILSKNSHKKITPRYGQATLYKHNNNSWVLFGDLGA